MKRFPLDKRHKLCRLTDIDRLFAAKNVGSAIAFPLRAIWVVNNNRLPSDAAVKILVSVPKKRLRRAVDRVTMRRRIREAYRLNRGAFEPADAPPSPLDVAFVYVADRLCPYARVAKAMNRLLASIHKPVIPSPDEPSQTVK